MTLDVPPDQAPTDAPDAGVTLVNWTAGEGATWEVNLTANYTVVHLRVHEGFNVDRPKQLVPLHNDRHFVELHQGNVTDVDHPARVFNITDGAPDGDNSTGVAWTTRVGIPGPTTGNLTLHRDVAPPRFTVDAVRNITHIGFTVRTTTSEPAVAELVVTPEDPEEIVRTFPVVKPGTFQTYPVQGLEADSNYTFQVTFWDWSGNNVSTGDIPVTTAQEPDVPTPILNPISPEPNGTITPNDVLVQVAVQSPGAPVLADGVRMFVDKEEVNPPAIQVQDGVISYESPTPLPTREVSFSVEVTNSLGGTGIARWSAQVVDATGGNDTPLGVPLALLGLLAAGLVQRGLRPPRTGS